MLLIRELFYIFAPDGCNSARHDSNYSAYDHN